MGELSAGEGSSFASRRRPLAFVLESLYARVLAELLAALSPVRRVRLLLGWPRLWPVEGLCEARQQMLRQRFSLGQLQRNLPLNHEVGRLVSPWTLGTHPLPCVGLHGYYRRDKGSRG